MATGSSVDFRAAEGIHSVAAAVVFTVLYVPLLGIFIFRAFKNTVRVHIVLAIFCAVRVASFAMRTYIAGSQAAAYDMGLNITYAVLSGLGFLGLLQSAYTLVVNRSVLQGSHAASNPLTRLMQREKLVNLILTVALVLSIVSSTKSFDPASFSLAQTLRVASVTIFLVVTALTTFLAAQLVLMERSTQHMLAMLIILLLLVREVFSEASAQSSGIGKNEALWYVLDSVSEVVAVALFAAPGLVPAKEKLQVAEEGQRKGSYVGL